VLRYIVFVGVEWIQLVKDLTMIMVKLRDVKNVTVVAMTNGVFWHVTWYNPDKLYCCLREMSCFLL